MQVLLVDNQFNELTEYRATTVESLIAALYESNVDVIVVKSIPEAHSIVTSKVSIHCVLLTRTLNLDTRNTSTEEINEQQIKFLDHVRERQPNVPAFLLSDRGRLKEDLSLKLMQRINELAWIWEDSAEFIAGRIKAAIVRYMDGLLPPLVSALKKYNEIHEYSWAAPGHQGGVGFRKTPTGRAYHDFFGANLFRLDLGIERSELGSLLDHTGAFRQAEENISRIFGSNMSYSVVVGTSGSNRSIMQACIKEDANVIIDRNCHKSIEQGMILTGAKPTYMIPTRNQYGIIGPVGKAEMKKVAQLIVKQRVPYCVLTNCTYDGICYDAKEVEKIMEAIPFLHFDEAWYGYARFNDMYADHYAMRGDPPQQSEREQTIFATQSSHKMLNALSQGSYIHVRHGKHAVDFSRFNQAYMMHTTTSPLYTIALSNDVAAQMMDGKCGRSLTQEMINEAVDFRQALARLYREFKNENADDWFFKPWNADRIGGLLFEDIPTTELTTKQSYWILNSRDDWHGFYGLDDNWVMLDPIKVSIISPGMESKRSWGGNVVPAHLVSAWLVHHGIVPTRTNDFQLMFLFSMGVTKGKWGTLLESLLAFKLSYDANRPIREALPQLPDKYGEIGLRDLGAKMAAFLEVENLSTLLNDAFNERPKQVMCPRKAYQSLIDDPITGKSNVEPVPIDLLSERVVANAILPYPPGIPMMISGERFGDKNSSLIRYLKALENWDRDFPGFEHITEGVERDEAGKFTVQCVVEID